MATRPARCAAVVASADVADLHAICAGLLGSPFFLGFTIFAPPFLTVAEMLVDLGIGQVEVGEIW